MQHYLSTEELKMNVQRFLTQLPKRVREALRRYGSIVRSLILFVQAYFCVSISCENIYGTYQVLQVMQTIACNIQLHA